MKKKESTLKLSVHLNHMSILYSIKSILSYHQYFYQAKNAFLMDGGGGLPDYIFCYNADL